MMGADRSMSTARCALVVALALGLMGCAGGGAPAPSPSALTVDPRFVLDEGGLGPLRRGAAVDVATVAALYPELDIVRERYRLEGLPEERLRARKGPETMFEIVLDAGRVRAISAHGFGMTDALGGRVGARAADLPLAPGQPCFPLAEGQPAIACPAGAPNSRLQYLFRPDGAPADPRPADARAVGMRLW